MCFASEKRKEGKRDSKLDHDAQNKNKNKCIKVLASDSCFRNSIGGSCTATRNDHEQVESYVASKQASTKAKDVQREGQAKPSIASQKGKTLLGASVVLQRGLQIKNRMPTLASGHA